MTKTVLFIHGAWMTPECWDSFRTPFEAAGYSVVAPAWPTIESGRALTLRQSPPPGLGSLSVGQICDHYEAIIRALPEPPVIVGHSFGGLFTQILLDRGLGAAGVAVDPAPIGGVIPGPVSLAAALPVVARWNAWNRTFTLSRQAFAETFANTTPAGQREAAYERLVVPTSGKIFCQAALGLGTGVKPRRRKVPLLVIVGKEDRTVTPYVARATYRRQKKSPARTDFRIFPGRSHFLIAEPGWEEVANATFDWVRSVA